MIKISFDDLKGKTCAITGGGGVIGKALADGYASVGMNIAIIDIEEKFAKPAADDIAKNYNVKTAAVSANVLDEKSLLGSKEKINKELGKIDVLINCAGGNSPMATTKVEMMDKSSLNDLSQTFFGLQLAGFQKVFDLNFMGTLLPTMVYAKDMLDTGKGVIINISSMNSYKPLTKIPAYSAAKCAINNFTEWLATHFAKLNIRVNAIAPGFFLTNQNRFLLTDEKTGELTERGKKIINRTPMGIFGKPDDLCGTAVYLASDISSFITGIVVPVDGGFNAYTGI
ncbi:MAG: SDR family oxidoreductase [Spirochaetes bacterium]|nr:SDR family oxidoreductase [Spirochaetota bacterium]